MNQITPLNGLHLYVLGVLVSGLGTENGLLCDVGFFSPCVQ